MDLTPSTENRWNFHCCSTELRSFWTISQLSVLKQEAQRVEVPDCIRLQSSVWRICHVRGLPGKIWKEPETFTMFHLWGKQLFKPVKQFLTLRWGGSGILLRLFSTTYPGRIDGAASCRWDTAAFPSQPRDVISRACPGFAPAPPPGHMPESPQPAPLDVELLTSSPSLFWSLPTARGHRWGEEPWPVNLQINLHAQISLFLEVLILILLLHTRPQSLSPTRAFVKSMHWPFFPTQ